MTAPSLLVALSCLRCGGELDGGPGARVFVCRPCALVIADEDPSRIYPLRYLSTVPAGIRPDLYAPFWRVDGTFSWETEDKAKQRIYSNLAPLGPLLFPAFWSPKAAYCDDLTLRYARSPDLLTLGPGNEPLLDGGRAPSPLSKLARLAWMAAMDRVADVTGVEGRFDLQSLIYVGVPFLRREDHFVDGILQIKVPQTYFV